MLSPLLKCLLAVISIALTWTAFAGEPERLSADEARDEIEIIERGFDRAEKIEVVVRSNAQGPINRYGVFIIKDPDVISSLKKSALDIEGVYKNPRPLGRLQDPNFATITVVYKKGGDEMKLEYCEVTRSYVYSLNEANVIRLKTGELWDKVLKLALANEKRSTE
jgi:hypothetical protein